MATLHTFYHNQCSYLISALPASIGVNTNHFSPRPSGQQKIAGMKKRSVHATPGMVGRVCRNLARGTAPTWEGSAGADMGEIRRGRTRLAWRGRGMGDVERPRHEGGQMLLNKEGERDGGVGRSARSQKQRTRSLSLTHGKAKRQQEAHGLVTVFET